MLIREILRTKGRDVITVAPETAVQEAMRILVRHNIGSLVVFDEAIRGILTERDLLRTGAADLQRLATTRVRDLMSADVITATPDMTVQDVMTVMTEHRIRHLPIVQDAELYGMISIGDVVNALRQSIEAENHSLHAYIEGTPL